MGIYFRTPSPEVHDLISSGAAQVYGSIIKDTQSGRIIGHLQGVGLEGSQVLVDAITGLGQSGNPVGLLTNYLQNRKISQQLTEIKGIVEQVQMLSYFNIALTAVNIGVSVAGFIMMNRKLNKIQEQLNRVEQKVDALLTNAQKQLWQECQQYANQVQTTIARFNSIKPEMKPELIDGALRDINNYGPFIDRLINSLSERNSIYLPIEIIENSYLQYLNLQKVTATAMYYSEESTEPLEIHVNYAKGLKENLKNKSIYQLVYDDCLKKSGSNPILRPHVNTIWESMYNARENNFALLTSQITLQKAIDVNKIRAWDEVIRQQEYENGLVCIMHE